MEVAGRTKHSYRHCLVLLDPATTYTRTLQAIYFLKMRRLIITILSLTATCAFSQKNYEQRLSSRLSKIIELDYFDNNVIMFSDTTEYAMAFPYWDSSDDYYEGDIVRFKNCQYVAKKDTKGKMPDVSFDEWQLARGPHPYLFLRDTAKVEDLKRLLLSDSPYIKAYSFAALSKQKYDGLFKVVIDNLKDTTKILEISSDVESEVYPVEMMMWYAMSQFTKNQKEQIRKLILSEYSHLKRCLEYPYW